MRGFHQPALLRVYTDQNAIVGDRALYSVIVARALQAELGGATVLRGRMGFGESGHMHLSRPFDLGDNLPLVVEIVDEEDKLRAFAANLADLQDIGLVTLEKVAVLRYGGHQERRQSAAP